MLTWTIPNFDPYVNYVLNQVAVWVAANAVTILVLTNVFTWLKKKALEMEEIKDNKTLSLIGYYALPIINCTLYVLTFKWARLKRNGNGNGGK
jgi:hypothetical protein